MYVFVLMILVLPRIVLITIYIGASFRQMMYPGQGGGVLRLHASYRHDLKIKASDEGRVMKTAAAFTKGYLFVFTIIHQCRCVPLSNFLTYTYVCIYVCFLKVYWSWKAN